MVFFPSSGTESESVETPQARTFLASSEKYFATKSDAPPLVPAHEKRGISQRREKSKANKKGRKFTRGNFFGKVKERREEKWLFMQVNCFDV